MNEDEPRAGEVDAPVQGPAAGSAVGPVLGMEGMKAQLQGMEAHEEDAHFSGTDIQITPMLTSPHPHAGFFLLGRSFVSKHRLSNGNAPMHTFNKSKGFISTLMRSQSLQKFENSVLVLGILRAYQLSMDTTSALHVRFK